MFLTSAIALTMTTLAARPASTTCPAAMRCPENDLCSIVSPNGAAYQFHCNTDYSGAVIQVVHVSPTHTRYSPHI